MRDDGETGRCRSHCLVRTLSRGGLLKQQCAHCGHVQTSWTEVMTPREINEMQVRASQEAHDRFCLGSRDRYSDEL